MGERRGDQAAQEPAPPVVGLADAVIPPAAVYQDLQAARAQVEEFRRQCEELQAKLDLKSKQVEDELRRKTHIKDLVIRMNAHVGALERESQKARYEAEVSQSKAQRLYEDAVRAESRLQDALLQLEAKDRALKSLQARLRD